MTSDRHERLTRIFVEASARPPAAWPAFLDEACADDAELRSLVESLLAHHTGRPTRAVGQAPLTLPAAESVGRLEAGTLVDGKYRVDALLGVGGMGEVYRATQLNLDRVVALKVLPAGARSGAGKRFEREALAVARLRHPHIVTIHDLGLSPGVGAYIVMEYVAGRSLRQELKDRERLPTQEAVDLTRQVCAAVHAAHRAGVIHRDLKPENILLEGEAGRAVAKVLDFGIAKLAGASGYGDELLTAEGVALGTPMYMSPEQCRGEALDPRSDVYALGCVLYELLTGVPPFAAETALGLLALHTTAEPAPPSRRAAGLWPGLDGLVLRALAKEPKDRFDSAAAFGEALGDSQEPITRPLAARDGRADTAGFARTTGQDHDGRQSTPNNLPQATARFIGRSEQVAGVRRQLEANRLVTLTGPGGIGKTRLGLEVAVLVLGEHPGGVWLVELASLVDASLVPQIVARATGMREEPGRDIADSLGEWLGEKRALLVLDNCEHLVDACARLAEKLLRGCPEVRVLATSREALGIAGEAVWPVPALSVPAPADAGSLEEASAHESVRLFADRAALSKLGFRVDARNMDAVVRICRQLDGIPLAIELAAARVKVLSVEQILAKLDDRFRLLTGGGRTKLRRLQTMEAAIDWSHDLLTERERLLLRRLSVFAGGWTLEAAEVVCGEGGGGREEGEGSEPRHRESSDPQGQTLLPPPSSLEPPFPSLPPCEILDLLARLVDKSLVNVDEQGDHARYRMLETIRQYAGEKLRASGEASRMLERHQCWALDLADRAERMMNGPGQAGWLESLEAEHDNLRAVLRRGAGAGGDGSVALRLAGALGRFWVRRGHVREGRAWLDEALSRGARAATGIRARASYWAGVLAYWQSDYDCARAHLDDALSVQQTLGDMPGLCRTLFYLSQTVMVVGEHAEAAALCERNLELARELDDWQMIVWAGANLGRILMDRGEFERATRYMEESLAGCRSRGTSQDTAVMLFKLAEVVRYGGDLERAEALLRESMELEEELGGKSLLAAARILLGSITADRGDHERALALHKEALVLTRDTSYNRHDMAYIIECIACTAVAQGDPERALRLVGAASHLREAIKATRSLTEQTVLDGYLDRARQALTREEAQLAFVGGGAMTFEDAVAYALDS